MEDIVIAIERILHDLDISPPIALDRTVLFRATTTALIVCSVTES